MSKRTKRGVRLVKSQGAVESAMNYCNMSVFSETSGAQTVVQFKDMEGALGDASAGTTGVLVVNPWIWAHNLTGVGHTHACAYSIGTAVATPTGNLKPGPSATISRYNSIDETATNMAATTKGLQAIYSQFRIAKIRIRLDFGNSAVNTIGVISGITAFIAWDADDFSPVYACQFGSTALKFQYPLYYGATGGSRQLFEKAIRLPNNHYGPMPPGVGTLDKTFIFPERALSPAGFLAGAPVKYTLGQWVSKDQNVYNVPSTPTANIGNIIGSVGVLNSQANRGRFLVGLSMINPMTDDEIQFGLECWVTYEFRNLIE